MTVATSLQIGKKYLCEIDGLTYYSRMADREYPVAALVEFVLVDDAGEIVPEIIAVHLEDCVNDPDGLYEAEARVKFRDDWKAGTVQVMGRES